MNREGFQKVARIRLAEVRSLLKAKHYDGAYYLAGFVIECALKACIARKTRRHDYPPDPRYVRDECYTHSLARLLKAAGLETTLVAESRSNLALGSNWSTIKDWAVGSRYEASRREKAEAMYKAITTRKSGVLRWIQQRW